MAFLAEESNHDPLFNVKYIKANHNKLGGDKTGAEIAKTLGISQGRVSQLLKSIKGELQPVNQEATASTAEA